MGREDLQGQVRKEGQQIEELEAEVKEAAAVGNKKLEAEQQAVVEKMPAEPHEKKKKLERLHALAETAGAPQSPPGMYYWPTAEEQKALAVKSENGLKAHMDENIKRLQGVPRNAPSREGMQDGNSTVSELDDSQEDVPQGSNNTAAEAQWSKVASKLKTLFQQKL